ncbi:uncharacterized protein LOC143913305 isoform X1 [Arctopsyche grandis]|uniref:uncharacterized protein LOC143913305 isoform X1 n=2 Tax=Arctopsyche grandis TaxID=121162 RepID=UPI00406D706F
MDLKFPEKYKYKVDSISDDRLSMKIFAEIHDIDGCADWVSLYAQLTNSRWIVSQSRGDGGKYVCRKYYKCQFSRKNKKLKKINFDCLASINIIVKYMNTRTRYLYQHVKDNFPAIITINLQHSHDTESAEALTSLAPSSATFDRFQCYFHSKMSVAEAIREHAAFLKEEFGDDDKLMVNGTFNPKSRTVAHWHEKWKKNHLGDTTAPGMIKKIYDTIEAMEKVGAAKIKFIEDPFTVCIMTPLMERASNLQSTKDIIFIDSTSSCDLQQNTITFVLTESVVGAVPLAVIITKGQTTAEYSSAFTLLKDFLGDINPRYIMTDDSNAERSALSGIFKDSKLVLCAFHISQAVWRWLWDAKHGILIEDRKILHKFFKNILISSSEPEADIALIELNNSRICQKYLQWIKYVEKYWERRESWCFAYRNQFTRGNQTNNYAEITVRIFKDIVLNRCKAFNAVDIIGYVCVEMNRYYKDRLMDFAHGRNAAKKHILNPFTKKITYLTKDNIVESDNGFVYIVPSQKIPNLVYEVDIRLECCTCNTGYLGNMCKHQAGVIALFHNVKEKTLENRYSIAVLALGDKANTKEFYKPLEKHPTLEQFSSSSSTDIQQPSPSSSTDIQQPLISSVLIEQLSSTSECIHNIIAPVQDDQEILNWERETFDKLNKNLSIYHRKKIFSAIEKCKNPSDYIAIADRFSERKLIKKHYRAPINVQPTAVARRRSGVTRGNKRLSSGRPALVGVQKKKKRRHNLAENISLNRPNAV